MRTLRKGITRVQWLALGAAFLCVVVLGPGASRAQGQSSATPRYEVSAAYSYVRTNVVWSGTSSQNLQGGSASVALNLNDKFGLVADVGGYKFTGLAPGLSSNLYTFLAGPRLSYRKSARWTPFAQLLLGGGQWNASNPTVQAGESGFVMAIGGGLDVGASRHIALRAGQVEYLMTRFASASNGSSAVQNNLRISAGVVFRFGSR